LFRIATISIKVEECNKTEVSNCVVEKVDAMDADEKFF
jgi:hypothetical protein